MENEHGWKVFFLQHRCVSHCSGGKWLIPWRNLKINSSWKQGRAPVSHNFRTIWFWTRPRPRWTSSLIITYDTVEAGNKQGWPFARHALCHQSLKTEMWDLHGWWRSWSYLLWRFSRICLGCFRNCPVTCPPSFFGFRLSHLGPCFCLSIAKNFQIAVLMQAATALAMALYYSNPVLIMTATS